MDDSQPVLVGVSARTQRVDDSLEGHDAVGLMVDVALGAIADAGVHDLGVAVGWVGVPEGTAEDPDPGSHVARALGAPAAHTVLADVGVLQQDLLSAACMAVAEGRTEVALVVGGEARHRERVARRAGVQLPTRPPASPEPDVRWKTHDLGVADVEIERNIVAPVISYALIDRALAASRGWDDDGHRRHLAALWSRFAGVAAGRVDAWDRSAPDAATIVTPGPDNRLLAVPYTKLLASQWNVDQAAAVVVCSVATARRLGVDPGRWVFPWAATVCNHAVPLVARADLHRSPGAAAGARRVLELGGLGVEGLDHVDLYSCFPAAVQVMAAELGLELTAPFESPPTVTGGMTFGGGPLNNYVLQALVELVGTLRAEPGAVGLSSSISGMLTKQGWSLWSTAPAPTGAFRHEDVTEVVAGQDPPRPVDPAAEGQVVVLAATVDHAGLEPRAVAVCETPDGDRTVAQSTDEQAVAAAGDLGFIGATVSVAASGLLRP